MFVEVAVSQKAKYLLPTLSAPMGLRSPVLPAHTVNTNRVQTPSPTLSMPMGFRFSVPSTQPVNANGVQIPCSPCPCCQCQWDSGLWPFACASFIGSEATLCHRLHGYAQCHVIYGSGHNVTYRYHYSISGVGHHPKSPALHQLTQTHAHTSCRQTPFLLLSLPDYLMVGLSQCIFFSDWLLH